MDEVAGLAYFSGVLGLTTRLDGAEVITGILNGLKDGAQDD